ncbi:MAG: hypothetical protein KAU49_03045 [Candidatus Krumholzibacteria bacterium]|nr:hypothetical protein [Candidatus Krumholzibacteria bacterium]
MNERSSTVSGEYTVGVQGWFSCAWHAMMARPNVVLRGLAVMLLFALVSLGLGMLPGGAYIGYIVQFMVGQVLQAGWYLFCLRLVREEEVSPAVIFEPFKRFWQVWRVAIVVPLLTALGLLLFVIPGLYFWARFGMAIFAAVDRRLDVNEALEFSSRITEGNRLQILLLHLMIAAIGIVLVMPSVLEMNNLGMITLLAYVFIMTPLAGTAYAAAYDSLVETKAAEEEE